MGERQRICALYTNRIVNLLCSHGLIPVQTSRSLPFRGERGSSGVQGGGDFPLHSYQLSRLMRLDWITGINQVGTV